MKKVAIVAISALALACGSGFAAKAASSSNLRIGVVNVQEVVQKAPEAKQMNDALEKVFKPRQETLATLNKKVIAEHNNLSRNSSVMSANKREKLQSQLLANQTKLRQMAQAYQGELLQARAKDMHKLFNHIKSAVVKVAKQDRLNLVIESHSIAYVKPSLDITKQVVKVIK